MHSPDGFIDGHTSVALGAVAAAGVGVSLRRAAQVLDQRRIPLAAAIAAVIFAGQMLDFPVADGTSGHLIGGVLAAVLLGPWLGATCVAAVVVVQALLFADGGLSALGTNVVTMALVTALGGYLVFAGLHRVLPRHPVGVVAASGLAAGTAVVLASLTFSLAYAIGGTGSASVGAVTASMVGVHVLIGLGEGLITALAVSAVLASRPDLVWGARDLMAAPDGTDAEVEAVMEVDVEAVSA